MKRNLEKRLEDLERRANPMDFKLVWYDDDPCHEPGAQVIQLRWLDEVEPNQET